MVIQDVPLRHGPNIWMSSMMWDWRGEQIDMFRIKSFGKSRGVGRGKDKNVMLGRNEYQFLHKQPCNTHQECYATPEFLTVAFTGTPLAECGTNTYLAAYSLV